MPRKPTGTQLADQVDDLIKALGTAKRVFPVLAEQARLEIRELVGGLPTAEHGADHSTDPPPYYNDPTGETVVNFRPVRDGNCDPTQDLERIAHWVADVQQLVRTTRRMLNNAPAVTLAVVNGRRPTDGRSAEEHDQRKFVRVLTDTRCLIEEDHGDEDRFGPGQLRRGLCNRHRMAFDRWQERHQGQLAFADGGERLSRWRAEVYERPQSTETSLEGATILDMGSYKSRGVKKVA